MHIEGAQDMPLAVALEPFQTAEKDEGLYMTGPLWKTVRTVWQGWTPQTKWEELTTAFGELRIAVDDMTAASRELEQYDALLPSASDETRPGLVAEIVAYEARFQQHPVAFGTFAVRRFLPFCLRGPAFT